MKNRKTLSFLSEMMENAENLDFEEFSVKNCLLDSNFVNSKRVKKGMGYDEARR